MRSRGHQAESAGRPPCRSHAREPRSCSSAGASSRWPRSPTSAAGQAGAPRRSPWTSPPPTPASGSWARCLGNFERIDVLVNNAGTSAIRTLDQLTDEDWQTQWELQRDRADAADARRRARDGRAAAGAGSSTSARRRASGRRARTWPTRSPRPPSCRCRVRSRTCTPRKGVLINAVAPGPVGTELWMAPGGMADQAAQAQGKTREEVLAATAARSPLGRFGTEEEIAAVITFLCSDAGLERRGRRLVGRRRGRARDHLTEIVPPPWRSRPARPVSHSPRSTTRSAARRSASTPRPSARPTRCTSTSTPPARPGYADVVAPPMFAVVYAGGRWARPCSTRRSGSTSRCWSTAARSSAGDRWSSPATRSPPRRPSRTSPQRGGMGFYVFESVSSNQRGETVCTGTWTNIVQGDRR